MSSAHVRSVFSRRCKECGKRFSVTGDTVAADLARGLSEPARCPKCRKAHGTFIKVVGSGYFLERRRGTPDPRCAGKYGLGYIEHPEPDHKERSYELTPTPEQLEKFKILEPAVQKLIRNLEDPQGTKVSILVGPTGTGKSVWAPTQILRSSIGREGRICVTQPRLVTLRTPKGKSDQATTPGFVAKSLLGADAVGAGQEVGLLYSGEGTKSDRYTRLLYVTDGILIRWILSGQLGRFSVVMIDEAHEQSSNMELIFALLRYHLPLYPRLRLVIMSATMDVERFAKFFGDGTPESVFVAAPDEPATRCEIHDRWPDGEGRYSPQIPGFKVPENAKECPNAIAQVVKAIRQKDGFTRLGNPRGDVLCFVPTVRLVDETVQALKKLQFPDLDVFPCHAQLDDRDVTALQAGEVLARTAMEQNLNTPRQRVIVATNYAETSVTFANLKYVIDTGFIMEPEWNPVTCSMSYPTRRHSQAGCTQRKGRVGRVQDGEVFRLYTKTAFEDPAVFSKNPRAAIAREPIEKFLLTAKAAGIANLEGFQWLGFDGDDELQKGERERSLSALARHGIVDKDGDITPRGLELEGIKHSSLDWSRAMSESDGMACSLEVATFLAFTELQHTPFLPNEKGLLAAARWSEGCADDLEFYLRLFHHWSRARQGRNAEAHADWAKAEGLDHRAFRDVEKNRADVLKQFAQRTHTDLTFRSLDLSRVERVRLVLTRALYPWVYLRAPNNDGYTPLNPELCPCKATVWIDQDSACALNESPDAFLCVSRGGGGGKVFAAHVVCVRTEWLEAARTQTPLGIALLASGSGGSAAAAWEKGAQNRITAEAKVPLSPGSFRNGQSIRFKVLRVKHAKQENGKAKLPHTVLAMEEDSKKPVTITFHGETLRKGDLIRAHVVDASQPDTLVVTQERIRADYRLGAEIRVKKLRLVKEMRDEETPTAPVTAHRLEIEPGITGVVRRREAKPKPGLTEEKRRHTNAFYQLCWRRYLGGQVDTLEILKNDAKGITFSLHFPPPHEGARYRGVVTEVEYNRGRVQSLKVLFLPGRTGKVFWRDAPQGSLARYRAGDELDVRITRIKRNDRDFELYDLTLA